MGLLLLLGTFALGIVIGMPVAFAMGIAAATAFFYEGFPMLITFQRATSGVTVFSLLAIPFFIFAGEIMLRGGIAQRIVSGFHSCFNIIVLSLHLHQVSVRVDPLLIKGIRSNLLQRLTRLLNDPLCYFCFVF